MSDPHSRSPAKGPVVSPINGISAVQATLYQSDLQLRLAIEGAGMGIWEADLASGELSWSKNYGRLFRREPWQYPKNPAEFLELVHPDDRDLACRALSATSSEYRCEFRILMPDGSFRWHCALGCVESDTQGLPRRLVGVGFDVTDRKESEAKAVAAEARFRALIANSYEAIAILGQDTYFRYVSPSIEQISGFTPDEFIAMPAATLVHPDDVATMKDRLQRLFSVPGSSEQGVFRGRHKDGSWRWLQIFDTNRVDDPNIGGIVVNIRDITEWKEAEQARRESDLRLRLAIDGARMGTCDWNLETDEIVWSERARACFGLSADVELTRDLVASLIHPDDRALVDAAMQRAIDPLGKGDFDLEYRIIWPDGSVHWVHAQGMVLFKGSGAERRCTRRLALIIDITQSKLASDRLALQQAEILHVSRLSSMGQMVAALSHEIGQPLNAVTNFAWASSNALGSEKPLNIEELRRFVDEIARQSIRAGEILKRLRDFTRKTPPSKAACDVNAVLRDSVELVQFSFRLDKLQVEWDTAEPLPPVWGDRIQLQQVFINLLSNAQDAMREGEVSRRVVTLTSFVDQAMVVVELKDRGTGVRADLRECLFEPFVTSKPRGMGIGLSIAQTIIMEHRGAISFTNNSFGGTTFRVILPSNE